MSNDKRYWFRAKQYGYGWSLPAVWQGWAVLGAWVAALVAARLYLRPGHIAEYRGVVAAMLLLLVLICYWKGEPARWRWGKPDTR